MFRRLPHQNMPGVMQHVVFRLADALPPRIYDSLAALPNAQRLEHVETLLDAGHGSRMLGDPAVASIVADALLIGDGARYRLFAWCVMPTHVHVLAQQGEAHALADIVHGWKSFTAHRINAALRRRGPVWAANYFDRFMRRDAQAERTAAYIEANPVAAGLCSDPPAWPWSSAAKR